MDAELNHDLNSYIDLGDDEFENDHDQNGMDLADFYAQQDDEADQDDQTYQ